MSDAPEIRELSAERICLGVVRDLPLSQFGGVRSTASLEHYMNHAANEMVMAMDAYILGMPEKEIEIHKQWPADWWQAVKERWFPKSWLARWPVRYERVDVHETIYKAVCPHADCAPREDHFTWLTERWFSTQPGSVPPNSP